MGMRTRKDLFPGLDISIKTTHIWKASRLVSKLTGFAIAPNKAIVGGNAFRHESGIHQDGVLKERSTYEIIRPEDVGFTERVLSLASIQAAMRSKNVCAHSVMSCRLYRSTKCLFASKIWRIAKTDVRQGY